MHSHLLTTIVNMKQIALTLTALILLASHTGAASEPAADQMLPRVVSINWDTSERVGQTSFRKFGLHIYDASFWSLLDKTDGTSKNGSALSITYAKNIRAKRLLSSTHKEWKRLGFGQQYPIDAWLGELEKIWPDVKPGDSITAVVTEHGDCIFYSNNRELGRIPDTQFGPAFLDIWLHVDARYSQHRKELLGEVI